MKSILKAAGYLFTYTSATILVYNIFLAGIFFKTNSNLSALTLPEIEKGVYIPMIFAFLSLAILLLSQTRLIKNESASEKLIYGCFNIVFFVVVLALGIIMVVLGLTKEAEIFSVCGLPVLFLAIIEIGYGIIQLIQQNKMAKLEAKEKVSEAAEKKEPEQK